MLANRLCIQTLMALEKQPQSDVLTENAYNVCKQDCIGNEISAV